MVRSAEACVVGNQEDKEDKTELAATEGEKENT